MNRDVLFNLLGIALASVALGCCRSNEAVSTEEDTLNKKIPDTLCVTIWPGSTRVSVRSYFDILVRVTNASDRTQSFEVFGGAWRDHWKPDNPRVRIPFIESIRNPILTIKLQPGESYEKKMESVQLGEGAPSTIIVFKIGFTPRNEKKTYWSNRVVLGIKPPIAQLDENGKMGSGLEVAANASGKRTTWCGDFLSCPLMALLDPARRRDSWMSRTAM